MKALKIGMALGLIGLYFGLSSCSDKDNLVPAENTTHLAKGADVSWMTEMEAAGVQRWTGSSYCMDLEWMRYACEYG